MNFLQCVNTFFLVRSKLFSYSPRNVTLTGQLKTLHTARVFCASGITRSSCTENAFCDSQSHDFLSQITRSVIFQLHFNLFHLFAETLFRPSSSCHVHEKMLVIFMLSMFVFVFVIQSDSIVRRREKKGGRGRKGGGKDEYNTNCIYIYN